MPEKHSLDRAILFAAALGILTGGGAERPAEQAPGKPITPSAAKSPSRDPEAAANLGFEDGTLRGWTAEGDAFRDQPIEGDTIAARPVPGRTDMRSGHAGRFWIGTYERRGDEPTGTLTSAPVTVAKPWCSFLVGGGRANSAVELVRANTGEVICRASGEDAEEMKRVAVDLKAHVGQPIRIRLVDRAGPGWAHINFDDFRFHDARPEAAPVVASLLAATAPNRDRAANIEVRLNTWLERQSPDGRIVVVHAAFVHPEGFGAGLVADWGDGTRSTGFFPLAHRYLSPGKYTVTLTGYLFDGTSKSATLPVTVPEARASEIARVTVSEDVFALRPGENRSVAVKALDARGQAMPLDGRRIEVFAYPGIDGFKARIQGATIRVDAVGPADQKVVNYRGTIGVYVDGVEATRPINVVSTRVDRPHRLLKGKNVSAYLPDDFLSESPVPGPELVKVWDAAYRLMVASIAPDDVNDGGRVMQFIGYDPPAHGYNGNPLNVGDTARPNRNRCDLIPVTFHEMGHNFGPVKGLFTFFSIPGAFYQETSAELYVQWCLEKLIAARPDRGASLSPGTLDWLKRMRRQGRDFHAGEMKKYVERGMRFNFDNTADGSHPLVQRMFEFADRREDLLPGLNACFDKDRVAPVAEVLGRHGATRDDRIRVTLWLAATGSLVGEDVRPAFRRLNFPIDDALYEDLVVVFRSRPRPQRPR